VATARDAAIAFLTDRKYSSLAQEKVVPVTVSVKEDFLNASASTPQPFTVLTSSVKCLGCVGVQASACLLNDEYTVDLVRRAWDASLPTVPEGDVRLHLCFATIIPVHFPSAVGTAYVAQWALKSSTICPARAGHAREFKSARAITNSS